jgi:hypothetical protein
MIIPSPAAHPSSTPFMAPQYLALLSLPHNVAYLPHYCYCKYTLRTLGQWQGGEGGRGSKSSDIMFTRISSFVRIGAVARAQTTRS